MAAILQTAFWNAFFFNHVNENVCILIQIPLKFVLKDSIDNSVNNYIASDDQ